MKLLSFGVLAALLSSCAPTQASIHAEQPVKRVRAESLTETEWAPHFTLHGTTRSVDRATISFPVGGRLARSAARIGDHVERGDVLAALEQGRWTHQLNAQVAGEAELQERIAQLDRDLERLITLEARGSVTTASLERTQADRAAAAAALRATQARRSDGERQLKDAVLRAPFAGVVVSVSAQRGETVAAGQAIVELAGPGIETAVEVPEDLWVQLERSTPTRVYLPALGDTVDGTIVDLAEAGGQGGLFPVVVRIPSGARRVAGLTTQVEFEMHPTAGIVAPIRSIVDPTGSGPAVFVVTDDHVRRVPVQVGALTSAGVVVTGVQPGDEVIVAGHSQLLDGQQVEVIRD